MAVHKRYIIDLSEYEMDPGHAVCTANEGDVEWTCSMTIDLDATDFTRKELKAIQTEIRRQFQADLRREYGVRNVYWEGDKRSPLLRFQKGDHVRFKGGEGEVVYVVPDLSLGVKTPDGRVLNFRVSTLDHFLFKKA